MRRLYEHFAISGEAGIKPRYQNCGAHQARCTPQGILDEAMRMRSEHPPWGAPLIRVLMHQAVPRRLLPTPRTLQRWFKKVAVPPAPGGRRPVGCVDRAERPHAVWQMDAVERVPLQSGQQISWLRLVDEFSGAVFQTTVFAQGAFEMVGPLPVQKHLRAAFSRWGRPERFRVDNGAPWGSPEDLPSDLALWLIGLGIHVTWNPPHQPQKNGVVERSQGVGKNWGEPGACDSVGELQQRLNRMDRIQRAEYPFREGRSRMTVFPELQHSKRRYDTAWEEKHWSLEEVLKHLSQYLLARRVDVGGAISIYSRNYYVGERYRGTYVSVMLDPLARKWVILNAEGSELRSHFAEQLTRDRIMSLNVSHRRRKPK